MRILFTMLLYSDIRDGRGFYSDFVHEVAQLGVDVTVVAPSLNGNTNLQNEGGVRVLRVKTGSLFNVHPVVKGVNNLRLSGQFKAALGSHFGNTEFDWVVSATPPITLAPLIAKLKLRFGCKSYLILRDIFPQNARDLGLINNSMVFNYFRRMEKRLYGNSDIIGCMSLGNIEYLRNHNPELPLKKMTMLPNWIGTGETEETAVDSESIKSKFQLNGKFVALFGGNFGKPQKIEAILQLAESVEKTHPNISFLLIGNGTEKNRIAGLIRKQGLTNVLLKDRLPQADYMELAAACDVGLVNLSEKFTIPNIPSRTLAYWASGLPVLASVDASTDLGEILETANGGLWSITGDLEKYRANLIAIYDDKLMRKQMGQNGWLEINEKYSTKVIARKFLDQILNFDKNKKTP